MSKYDEAARLLNELTEETAKVQTSIEEDREKVNQVVEEVEGAVKGLKDGEERWRDEMRDMRGEVETLKELVPRVCPHPLSLRKVNRERLLTRGIDD